MFEKEQAGFNLLKSKDVYAILDGDTSFRSDALDEEVSLPYQSGPKLVEVLNKFGIDVSYGSSSRWMYVKALLERGVAQVDEHEVLAVIGGVHLVACLELAAFGDHGLQVDVSRLLGHLDAGLDAQALGLVLTQKMLIAAAKLLELLDLLWRVIFPCAGTLHDAGSFRIDRAG